LADVVGGQLDDVGTAGQFCPAGDDDALSEKPAGSTVVVVTYVAPGVLTEAVLFADVYCQHRSRTAPFVASAALRRIASASAAVRCVEDVDAAVENAAKNPLNTRPITTSAMTISRSVSPRSFVRLFIRRETSARTPRSKTGLGAAATAPRPNSSNT
jgi:hypothetical protein